MTAMTKTPNSPRDSGRDTELATGQAETRNTIPRFVPRDPYRPIMSDLTQAPMWEARAALVPPAGRRMSRSVHPGRGTDRERLEG